MKRTGKGFFTLVLILLYTMLLFAVPVGAEGTDATPANAASSEGQPPADSDGGEGQPPAGTPGEEQPPAEQEPGANDEEFPPVDGGELPPATTDPTQPEAPSADAEDPPARRRAGGTLLSEINLDTLTAPVDLMDSAGWKWDGSILTLNDSALPNNTFRFVLRHTLDGRVVVEGSGSTEIVLDGATIGDYMDGIALRYQDGAGGTLALQGNNRLVGDIGLALGVGGQLTLQGAGTLEADDDLFVGISTQGSLTLAGGTVDIRSVYEAISVTESGSLQITGGSVTAISETRFGIGAYDANGGPVTISGGNTTVTASGQFGYADFGVSGPTFPTPGALTVSGGARLHLGQGGAADIGTAAPQSFTNCTVSYGGASAAAPGLTITYGAENTATAVDIDLAHFTAGDNTRAIDHSGSPIRPYAQKAMESGSNTLSLLRDDARFTLTGSNAANTANVQRVRISGGLNTALTLAGATIRNNAGETALQYTDGAGGTLALQGSNRLEGFNGLALDSGGQLTLQGAGTLEAQGSSAGIFTQGDLTIEGGTITAQGASAGILVLEGSSLEVTGGSITAMSTGPVGVGIGNSGSFGGPVTISGSNTTVMATGSSGNVDIYILSNPGFEPSALSVFGGARLTLGTGSYTASALSIGECTIESEGAYTSDIDGVYRTLTLQNTTAVPGEAILAPGATTGVQAWPAAWQNSQNTGGAGTWQTVRAGTKVQLSAPTPQSAGDVLSWQFSPAAPAGWNAGQRTFTMPTGALTARAVYAPGTNPSAQPAAGAGAQTGDGAPVWPFITAAFAALAAGVLLYSKKRRARR